MSTHPPTDEQIEILSAAAKTSDNLAIQALAGCGKSTTLEMVEGVVKTAPILYLVFNKKNAKEAEERMSNITTVRSFNAMGHRIWASTISQNLTLDANKTRAWYKDYINAAPRDVRSALWEIYSAVIDGVAMAKAVGYVPDGKYEQVKRLCSREEFVAALDEVPDDLTLAIIDKALLESIRAAYKGYIDYNDQVYMPAVFGGNFPEFPLVLVDEAQDLSPVNHALIRRLARNRLIIVGDPWQNIYGFRGAAPDGMNTLITRHAMKVLPLSVSFRCPQRIVENAQWHVPHFKWIKEGGYVEILESLGVNDIPSESCFICRNNAPLFHLAMQLLKSGRSIKVTGSDIGPRLISILRKLGPEESSQLTTLTLIDRWQEAKELKASKTAADTADCLRVFARAGKNLGQAIAQAEYILKQEGTICLTTGHKAKGLEWDTVIHLDPFLINLQESQDQNLRYVIQTRSLDSYFEIDFPAITW